MPSENATSGLKHLSQYIDSDDQDDERLKNGDNELDNQSMAVNDTEQVNMESNLDSELYTHSMEQSDNVSHAQSLEYIKFFKYIQLPPNAEPPTNGDLFENYERLQKRVVANMEKIKRGLDPIEYIQNSKSFKNPSIYEKLVSFCGIVEHSSNYKKEIFDPMFFDINEGNYKLLAQRQLKAYEREKNQKKSNDSSSITVNTNKSDYNTKNKHHHSNSKYHHGYRRSNHSRDRKRKGR